MKVLRRFIVGLMLTLLCCLLTPLTFAQEQPFNVTTSPNAFDLTTLPGTTIEKKLQIRNNGNNPLELKIEIKKLVPDEKGQLAIRDFKKEDTQQNWITIERAITAKPKEWTFVPLDVTIPEDAAFGYYWAILISPKEPPTGKDTTVTGSVAVPILLSVEKDGMKFTGKLQAFTTAAFSEYLPITFSVTFLNQGNVHTKPLGNIFIKDWTGKQVATLPLNKEQGSVLPGATRVFTTNWNDSFITYEDKIEDGKVVLNASGKAEKQLKFRFDKILDLRIGKYTATALLVVSGQDRDIPFEMSTTFFIFPWKIVLGAVIIVVLVLIGLVSTTKTVTTKIRGLVKK